jgi:hypothetical protein
MKVLLVLLALLTTSSGQQSAESIPDKVKLAKTVVLGVYWPEADPREKMEVQHEGEQFIKKWGRFELVQDISKADIAAIIVVRPTEVVPGFWVRLAAAYAAQGQTYCNTGAQSYGGGMVQAQTTCYTYPGNQAAAQRALLPSTVLGGSILILDASDVQKDMTAGLTLFTGNAKPLLASFAEAKGYAPLRGAAKRLKKLIDSGDKKKRR